jgi:hypothetical protein
MYNFIMAETIKIDDRELKAFAKELQYKRPSQIVAVIRQVLNDQAFAVRKEAQQKTLPNTFNIRSKWIISSILVDKANGKNTKKMRAEVGAKKRWKRNPLKDFLGLRQQENGETISDPGIETEQTRSGGIFSGRVKPSMRRDRLGNIIDDGQFPGSGVNRIIAMLRILERQNYKGAFYIKRNTRNFKKGIYKFKGKSTTFRDGKKHKQIQMVMDTSKNHIRIPKNPWLKKSVKKAITQKTVGDIYCEAFKKYTKQRPK